MTINDTGDTGRERLSSSTFAILAVVLSVLAVLAAAAVGTMPGLSDTLRAVHAGLAVLGGVGIWAAVRGRRGGDGKLVALSLTCALTGIAALVVLRVVA